MQSLRMTLKKKKSISGATLQRRCLQSSSLCHYKKLASEVHHFSDAGNFSTGLASTLRQCSCIASFWPFQMWSLCTVLKTLLCTDLWRVCATLNRRMESLLVLPLLVLYFHCRWLRLLLLLRAQLFHPLSEKEQKALNKQRNQCGSENIVGWFCCACFNNKTVACSCHYT